MAQDALFLPKQCIIKLIINWLIAKLKIAYWAILVLFEVNVWHAKQKKPSGALCTYLKDKYKPQAAMPVLWSQLLCKLLLKAKYLYGYNKTRLMISPMRYGQSLHRRE